MNTISLLHCQVSQHFDRMVYGNRTHQHEARVTARQNTEERRTKLRWKRLDRPIVPETTQWI